MLLPYESHGYEAYESIMHTLYEEHEWLERYVKNSRKGPEPEANGNSAGNGNGKA